MSKCFKWLSPCDQCSKKFSTTNSLKIHERTHIGKITFPDAQCLIDEKPSPCDQCMKQFSTTNSHKTHDRIHIGKRTFSLC